MPQYNFFCLTCDKEYKRILSVDESKNTISCRVCKESMSREVIPPTSRITEIIDNGIMAKKLEVLQDINEIMRDRSKKNG